MNHELLPFLFPLLVAAATPAQDSDDAYARPVTPAPVDGGARKVDAAAMRPALVVERARVVVIGEPLAAVALFAGDGAGRGLGRVPVLLGCGLLDAHGRLAVPLLPTEEIDTGTMPILVQAMQRRADGRVDASPIAALCRPVAGDQDGDGNPDGDADRDGSADGDVRRPMLELHNGLGRGFPIRAELIATDSVPPCYHLHFAVEVPTSGYSLHTGARRTYAGRTELAIELMEPNPDMRHLTVLETLRAFVDLGNDPGLVVLTVRKTAYADGSKGAGVLR